MHTRDTIRTLNNLIRTCRDAEWLCRTCAGEALGGELRLLISHRSEEWARQGDELQALVLLLDGAPRQSGSIGGVLLGAWISLRSTLLGGSDLSALDDWLLMQERALDRYETALRGYLPERIRRTVGLQADRTIERLGQISALCDQYAFDTRGISPL